MIRNDFPGMNPGDTKTVELDGVKFRILALDRKRYCVFCLGCRRLVHESTTGPKFNIRYHLKEEHKVAL